MVPFIIGGAVVATIVGGVIAYLASDDEPKKKKHATIVLLGMEGAGKSTLSHILEGKGYQSGNEYTTPSGRTFEIKVDICGIEYEILDSSGVKENAGSREEARKKLANLIEEIRKKSIFIYVFDAEDFVNREDRREEILLQARTYFDEAMEYRIIMKCLGTRRDKISGAERDSVVARIRKAVNVDTEIFDMTINPVEQIKEFISREA